ncbi:hypothetical protein CC85DRAFT_281416, partial [Cutaneotrichosporon oleaginosum]
MPDGTRPPAPRRAPAPVLDHTAFPHLLRAILDAAPPASLLALRATSRALRDAADPKLAHHLVLSEGVRTPCALRLPAHMYQYTRVLDLRAPLSPSHAHTHAGVPCAGCGARHRAAALTALLAAAAGFVALRAVRVASLAYADWATRAQLRRLRPAWAVYDEPGEAVRLAPRAVLVFRRAVVPALCVAAEVYLVFPCEAAVGGVLDALADAVFAWRPPATFVFVGAETWRAASAEEVTSGLVRRSAMPAQKTMARIAQCVRFISLTEFREMAGEDVFRL